ncbi:MAG: [FeFe] hydrogenase H-cluster maturation GTPase HydF [Bacteroidales bacterium]|nr:[FeFe] hydrogenase H-cluster maturation GTPase HydF [Bacteroidales bacterium]
MVGTPVSERLHIVLLGERNSGKSSLLNAVTGQQVAIVSDVPGTTTDHVSKAMEIIGLGPCVFIDTAGLDDSGVLGGKRVEDSLDAVKSADIVLAVVDAATGHVPQLPVKGVPVVPVLNKNDAVEPSVVEELSAVMRNEYGKDPVVVSALYGDGVKDVIEAIRENIPEDWDAPLLTAGLVEEGDLAVLVMPQDRQAPKGRLILPQQQVIRELLDRNCRIVCCTPALLAATLDSLKEVPAAIIADSQVLKSVAAVKADSTRLTSFSMLLAASKGDIGFFKDSARRIDSLTSSSRVLIAEACTHVPASEDIGRVKIPRLLRSRAGEGLSIDVVSGRDFPEDLSGYDLVIHCGACMFNRRYVLARVRQAKEQGVPMTNYGVAIAYINNLI